MEKDEKKRLLEKFLDEQCTDEELRQVELIRREPDTEELWRELVMQRFGGDWFAEQDQDQEMMDLVETKKGELLSRIGYRNQTGKIERNRWTRLMRYAAVLTGALLVTGLLVWQWKKNDAPQQMATASIEQTNPIGIPQRHTLPDNSIVYIGAGSTIRYPKTFSGDTREIFLEGEGFFEVTHDPQHPFIVTAGGVRTRVLGTSFKLSAFDGQEFSLAVATGKVAVDADRDGRNQSLAILTPGLTLSYDSRNGNVSKGTMDINTIQQWRTGEMLFDHQQMKDVVLELERYYGIKISFADQEIAGRRVSGTFEPKEPVRNVMDLLALIGEFTYETSDNNKFILYKQHMEKGN